MNKEKPFSGYFALVLGLLAMLPPLAIDMYLPSFLAIAQDLNVSQEKVQTTLALFTLGFAIGQLFWGPIADSFGRKPIILIGVSGSAIMAFLLTQVMDIHHFYLLRFIQGAFAAAPAVVAGALVRDLFDRNQFARVTSTITIIAMLAPLVAPITGGYLAKWFHWHSVFYTLAIMGILCALLVGWQIPETLKAQNRLPFRLNRVVKNFAQLIAHKATLGYIVASGLAFAGMFCFLTSGSLVYVGLFGVSAEHFGYFFILNIGIMLLMTFINGRLVMKVGSERMLRFGLAMQFFAGIWLAISATFSLGLWPMAIGVAFFVGMVSTISSNASAAILDKYPQMAGTANALTGTARFGIASLVGAVLSHIPLYSERPMLYAMAFCTLGATSCYYFMCYPHKK